MHFSRVRRTFGWGRYDYEGVASEGAEAMMDNLRAGPAQPGDDLGSGFELKGITSSTWIRMLLQGWSKNRLPYEGKREASPLSVCLYCHLPHRLVRLAFSFGYVQGFSTAEDRR